MPGEAVIDDGAADRDCCIHLCIFRPGRGWDEVAGPTFGSSNGRRAFPNQSMKQLLVFVLFSAMFCWLMFSPVYKHVLIIRQALLQQETDYLLEIGASGRYGYIDEAMLTASKERLTGYGFQPGKLEYEVISTNGASAVDPASPLLRGTGLRLTIRYPYDDLLSIDRLIGIEPAPADARISASGMKMSEYVP